PPNVRIFRISVAAIPDRRKSIRYLTLAERCYSYFETIPTKSRTDFCSEIENALPFSRANQNALDDPPSRFSARSIFKSSARDVVARIFANPASETPEQTPINARLPPVVPAKVRRPGGDWLKPLIAWPRSTRNAPHGIAEVIPGPPENSGSER